MSPRNSGENFLSAPPKEEPVGSLGRCSLYLSCGKRVFDLAMALAGLLVLAAPMTVISLAIFFMEGGPVLFRQNRVGRRGRLFTIYKFRTMRNGAGSNSCISIAQDGRATPVGRWLRRFKLDELPQLWNVLRGDMSFVGPRPDVPGYLDRLCGEARALWELRPGITGPATLLFRQEEELLALAADHVRFNNEVIYPEKVRLNLIYLRECSWSIDLACILATIAPTLARRLGIHRRLRLDPETLESRIRKMAGKYSVC